MTNAIKYNQLLIMFKLQYFYNPKVKHINGKYFVDYYCFDSKRKKLIGRCVAGNPTAVLKIARSMVKFLEKERPLLGRDGRIFRWFRWIKNKYFCYI